MTAAHHLRTDRFGPEPSLGGIEGARRLGDQSAGERRAQQHRLRDTEPGEAPELRDAADGEGQRHPQQQPGRSPGARGEGPIDPRAGTHEGHDDGALGHPFGELERPSRIRTGDPDGQEGHEGARPPGARWARTAAAGRCGTAATPPTGPPPGPWPRAA